MLYTKTFSLEEYNRRLKVIVSGSKRKEERLGKRLHPNLRLWWWWSRVEYLNSFVYGNEKRKKERRRSKVKSDNRIHRDSCVWTLVIRKRLLEELVDGLACLFDCLLYCWSVLWERTRAMYIHNVPAHLLYLLVRSCYCW